MSFFKRTKKNSSNFEKTALPSEKKGDIAVKTDGGFVLLVKHPWITEKSGSMINLRKYVFLVDKKANKSEISKNIESPYNVKISSLNIINIKGKVKRIKTETGKIPGKRKAIISLKEGYKIETMTV